MKRSFATPLFLAALLSPLAQAADEESAFTSRLSLASRAAFNISARFDGLGTGGSLRITPNGDAYNYDDGYKLTDSSGNAGDKTWYWGYDDSVNQVSGNTILLHSTSVADEGLSVSDLADPSPSVELVYNLELGTKGRARYGFEAAAGYQRIHVEGSADFLVTLSTVTDVYPFTQDPATLPPATPSMPYQGSYQGPGFLIGATPSTTTTTATPNTPMASQNELSAGLWTLRLGPYIEYPVRDRVTVGLSGGIEGGMLNANLSWNESAGSYRSAGEYDDSKVLVGFFVGGTVSWQFADRWSLSGGVQYHNLGIYEHAYQDRTVELNLNKALYATIGVGWSF